MHASSANAGRRRRMLLPRNSAVEGAQSISAGRERRVSVAVLLCEARVRPLSVVGV
jgi:hypothetical protein